MNRSEQDSPVFSHARIITLGAIFSMIGGLMWERVVPTDSSLYKPLRAMAYAAGGAVGTAVYSLFLRIEEPETGHPANEKPSWQDNITKRQEINRSSLISKS